MRALPHCAAAAAAARVSYGRGISLETEASGDLVVRGNTYALRDEWKALSGTWRPEEKVWVLPPHARGDVEALLLATSGGAASASASASASAMVVARAVSPGIAGRKRTVRDVLAEQAEMAGIASAVSAAAAAAGHSRRRTLIILEHDAAPFG